MKKNEAYAYLNISGFACTVEELTQRIGLQPSEAWHAGDPTPPPRPPRKFSAWHLRSRLQTSAQVEEHIADVLDQVHAHEAVLREVARDYGIEMACVGYFHEYYPGFGLDAGTVRRLADCGASIDLDFYHFYREQPEGAT